MNKLQSLIAKHEGDRLRMYQDTADPPKWTIGRGHNIEDNGISQAVSDLMFEEDVQSSIQECQQFDWFDQLNDVRQAVVVNMVFNMGMPIFKGFKKTIGFIASGDYYLAAIEMLDSKWAKQVGRRAIELSHMMKTGEWQ